MNRRQALQTLGLGGTSLLAACSAPAPAPGTVVKVGTLADFAQVGAFKTFSLGQLPGLVIRTAQKVEGGLEAGGVFLLAYSRICTHLGCTVNTPEQNLIECFCHGSRFDPQTAAVLRGPAGAPLPLIALEQRPDGIYATAPANG